MRVFVTGATGFVGSAVVQELLGAGHQVLGLARSEAGLHALTAAGAQPFRGDTEDLASLRRAIGSVDGVIHTAFNHDFTRFKANSEADYRSIEAMGDALAGSERPFIVTTALGVLPAGRLVSEADRAPADSPNPRVASEQAIDAVAARGVRIAAVRLPVSVHGPGDHHGFVPSLIAIARTAGVSAYPGEGSNQWPAVHRLDAARLYRLALEHGSLAPGTRYHAVADEGVRLRDIAERIGQHLHLPVEALAPADAAAHFGSFAYFAALDVQASSQQTRQQLGWQPTHPSLLADLDNGSYFPA